MNLLRVTRNLIFGALVLAPLQFFQARPTFAQGWVAARLDAPVLGADTNYKGPDKWEASLSWRYQRSDRHFTGHEENVNRNTEHSQVINRIHQPELTIKRNYNHGWSLAVGIPFLMAERSSPIRDASGTVVDRSVTQARGLGDITLTTRKWIWDPEQAHRGNLSLGIGIKIPTGANNVEDTRKRLVNGAPVYTVQTVDQSIQPGDGGFGFVTDLQAYTRFARDKMAGYLTGTYLINPEGVSGVQTGRSAPGEDIMSIADQYLARAGVSWFPGRGFGVSLGGRIEGVPVYDLVGSSDGFRRPGYAVSVEPGISYSRGPHTFSLMVPFAVERNRERSVPDKRNGTHGDAAFADYLILGGYFRKF